MNSFLLQQKDLDADCGGYFIVHVQLCRFKLSLPSCDASDFTRHATTTAVAMSGLGYNLHRIWPLDGFLVPGTSTTFAMLWCCLALATQ